MQLQGGRMSLHEALDEYEAAWQRFIAENGLEDFAESAVATTIGWKVADKPVLFQNLESLAEVSEQVHIATVEGRFIASVFLCEPYHGMRLLKVLERKPGAGDPLGLDSIDYLVQDSAAALDRLYRIKDGTVAKESNENHVWLSLRFGSERQFEAKFMDHILLYVAKRELEAAAATVLAELGVA